MLMIEEIYHEAKVIGNESYFDLIYDRILHSIFGLKSQMY